ncbi:RNA-binding protein mei2 homologue, putative [Plasmodium knowlesi strain H]|uniref:RNA-binding protein mei2 homologue, putative n=3 Tax=Plasmodium knowlesi TaxID=5850 RepID=A0A5K1UAB9_PLAKH|nr:RNA-binding protein mei2-like protein [Plasmodium knowlesi strain H]OTN64437.1 putative RNA-binding protein mei2-like protein [Plasmodium knowlesi]CAA9989096.1 MEI2-like RNA-binding protein, putative [Plasmodium knowlesi strain H]SBO27310.1 RNA-binding protein mei2 homologue, putative [Plasmodium knowlesi strain H]SBO28935.1 RNA-binding protein mei2 homologue, putative [Plasmodium knowlesi strain H]VVS78570.1 MEI2-like RNA-binding protein, putative [Plasmodium knowlesi strain H]|eukprot:XP_002261443.1 RNA-binding protein mei2-like protein [Plasmodium knowlesi strain H]
MNTHMGERNFTSRESDPTKKGKDKTTVHIKNTYISPYVLYNNKKGSNEHEFAKLNNLLTNEKNRVFIKHKLNYFKDGIHEKKILRYALINELNLKCFENRGNACELNSITTMIRMNSDYGSDKEQGVAVRDEADLVGNIKELTIIRSEDIIRGGDIIRSEEFISRKDMLHRGDVICREGGTNNEKTNDTSEKRGAPFKTSTSNEKECDYIGYSKYYGDSTDVPNSLCYIPTGSTCCSGGTRTVNVSLAEGTNKADVQRISNSNRLNMCCGKRSHHTTSSTNDVVYKCEDSIPLGTILNFHNLDNNNTNILTTVMLRNIPNKYTQKMLMNVMNEHFKGLYDFFYLPIDFRNKCNVGYAFINFIHPYYAELFIRFFNNYKLNVFKSNKVCSVTWGRVQGLKANIEHYRNSAIMTIPIPQYKPMLFQNGISVSWPESDGPLPAIKLRSQKY